MRSENNKRAGILLRRGRRKKKEKAFFRGFGQKTGGREKRESPYFPKALRRG
jgi:hypothetical protein